MTSESMYDHLKTTAENWIESYNEAHATRNPKCLSKVLTPDCKRTYMPPSFLKLIPSLANGLSVSEFERQEGANAANHEVYENEITDMTVDEKQRKVVIHTNRNAMYKDGRRLQIPQVNTLWMTEDGERVKEIVQFADSLLAKDVMDGMQGGGGRGE